MSQAIVTVNIGCKCGDTDMHDSQCAAFQQETEMLLAETVGKVSFTVDGQSHWQGVSERGISFSVLDPALIGPDEAKFGNPLQVLRYGLANLAKRYEQEAIAMTLGTSELVSPSVSTSNAYWDEVGRESAERFGEAS
jgi:hypothetical protein